jgi:hypothetical protein
VRFEVLVAMTTKSTIFWNVTPCSVVEVTDLSEGRAVSIFKVEEQAKQATACLIEE